LKPSATVAILRSAFALTASFLLFPGSGTGETAPAEKPICTTDRIEGVFAPGGYAVLIGWAVDPDQGSVSKVEVVAPPGSVGEVARWGEWRPDVMAHFARPDCLWSGWTSTVSFEKLSPGRYPVEVFAVGRDGSRSSCGRQELQVQPAPPRVRRPPSRVAPGILFRTTLFLLWLGLLGWAVASVFGLRPILLSAPVVGLALFAVVAEAGGAVHVRPVVSGLALTVVMSLALLRARPQRPRTPLPRRSSWPTIAATVMFALIAVVPLASHGDGAVLGDIDDAARECTVADSISRYGWHVPAQVSGYFSVIRGGWELRQMRNGDVYLLSLLADAFSERSHAVHSVAMLGAGCLLVFSSSLLALRVLRGAPRLRWLPPALVALNSTLIATLYGQHLGSLLGAGLFVLFLASTYPLLRSRRSSALVPTALCMAAGLSVYPEALPSWGVAALVSLMTIPGWRRRKRGLGRFALAAVLAVLLNPTALVRVARSWLALRAEPTLASSYSRMVVGDTHYFPSLRVVTGLEAYRIDSPAPVSALRARFILVVTVAIIAIALSGWFRLTSRRRWLVLTLLLPIALALWANFRLDFPYGYAKFLPAAVPLWAVAFTLLLAAIFRMPPVPWQPALRGLAGAAVVLVLILQIPSVRHVVRHAVRAVPSYDPAFRSLPALARVVGRRAAIRIEDYPLAGEHWIFYFLGDNPVDLDPAPDRYPGVPRFRITQRWRTAGSSARPRASSRDFSLIPIPAGQ
jgi:hypothetical protein